jgi:hypothetical protein
MVSIKWMIFKCLCEIYVFFCRTLFLNMSLEICIYPLTYKTQQQQQQQQQKKTVHSKLLFLIELATFVLI